MVGRPASRSWNSSQAEFLAREDRFRSPSYPLAAATACTLESAWEYRLCVPSSGDLGEPGCRVTAPADRGPGSGVTFYPFFLARRGYRVLAIDTDPVCERDFTLSLSSARRSPGTPVRSVRGYARAIPVEEALVDAVYSISVLEHIARPRKSSARSQRVLRTMACLS